MIGERPCATCGKRSGEVFCDRGLVGEECELGSRGTEWANELWAKFLDFLKRGLR